MRGAKLSKWLGNFEGFLNIEMVSEPVSSRYKVCVMVYVYNYFVIQILIIRRCYSEISVEFFITTTFTRYHGSYSFVLLCSVSNQWLKLTHWGRVTHICVGNLIIIGSDNGLSPGRRQAIIWTNAGISLFGPLGIIFSEIVIKVQTFSFKKMHFKMSSGKWRTSCLGLNVLRFPSGLQTMPI